MRNFRQLFSAAFGALTLVPFSLSPLTTCCTSHNLMCHTMIICHQYPDESFKFYIWALNASKQINTESSRKHTQPRTKQSRMCNSSSYSSGCFTALKYCSAFWGVDRYCSCVLVCRSLLQQVDPFAAAVLPSFEAEMLLNVYFGITQRIKSPLAAFAKSMTVRA